MPNSIMIIISIFFYIITYITINFLEFNNTKRVLLIVIILFSFYANILAYIRRNNFTNKSI